MTTILLADADIKPLEESTFQLVNIASKTTLSADAELIMERNMLLNNVLEICSKYTEVQPVPLMQADIRQELVFVAQFLENMSYSKEWTIASVKKRAAEVMLCSCIA